MLRKILLAMLSLLTVGQLAMVAVPVSAATTGVPGSDAPKMLEETGLGGAASAQGAQLPVLIGRIIRVLLSLLGIIFVVLMVYAGFKWMTARGESEPIDEAKSTIRSAIIGLIIIFLAYAITGFVIDSVLKATTNT
jgi:hypothetical protein